jgi:cytochrome c551/c552
MKLEGILKNSCITLVFFCGLASGLTGCGGKEDQPHPNAVAKAQPTTSQPPSVEAQSTPVPVPLAQVNTPQTTANSVNTASANPAGLDMPAVAKRHNCPACHSINKKIVGPAWMNVSIKYKGAEKFEYNGKEYPLVEGLMMKVSQGGSGHWGSMPMPANDIKGVMQSDIRELVLFVLGLAK